MRDVRSATTGVAPGEGVAARCGGRRRRRPRRRTVPVSAATSVGGDRPAVRRAARGGPSHFAGARRRRPVPRRPPGGPRAAPTSVVPSHSDARRPVQRGDERRTGRRSRPRTIATSAGNGRVRRITSPSSPSVPSEPTSRRQRSKPLTFFTVGPPALTSRPSAETNRACEQGVAHRAVAEPADAAAPDGQARRRPSRPPSRAARRTARARASAASSSATRRARAAAHGHLLGRDPRRCRRAPAPRRASGSARTADVPLRAPADDRDRAGRSRPARRTPRGRSRSRSHSDPCSLGDAAAGRRTEIRRAAPSAGWRRRRGRTPSRRRACASRSSGQNSSGMKSRFSRPMPCSPESTPPAATRRLHDLVARGEHPLHHARLAPVEHEQRVQVAVAGVEHVHHDEVVTRRRSRRPRAAPRPACVRGTTVSCR